MVYMQARYNSVGHQRYMLSWARLALIAQPSHPFPPSAIEAMHKSWQQFAWADSIMRLTKALPGVNCKHPLVLSGQRIELGA
jgi:hypothetical protein